MKRTIGIAVMVLTLAAMTAGSSEAGRHAKASRTAVKTAGAAVCDPSSCNGPCGPCPSGTASARTASASVTKAKSSGMCAGVDPATCPSACRRTAAATAVAKR